MLFNTDFIVETSQESIESANCNCDKKLQECRDEMSNNLAFEMFSKRLVNMLLSHISYKVRIMQKKTYNLENSIYNNYIVYFLKFFKEEEEVFTGNIYLEATSSQMQILQDFGNTKVSIRTVDSIISDIIRKPSTTFFEEAISYSELILSTIQRHVSSKTNVIFHYNFIFHFILNYIFDIFLYCLYFVFHFILWAIH